MIVTLSLAKATPAIGASSHLKIRNTAPVKAKVAIPAQPEPAPPPQVVVQPVTCQSEIAKYDWEHNVALAVSYAESKYDPQIVNDNPWTKDYSIGCFQINLYGANARTRPNEAQLKDPVVNVQWAHKIYVANGHSFLGQWGVCKRGVACY